MKREQAKEIIKRDIKCTDYLQAAPNHNGNNGYCCPACGSGTHGRGSTGAVKYYPESNTWHCFACDIGGDIIDAYKAVNGIDYNTAFIQLADRAGISLNNASQAHRVDEEGQQDKKHYKTAYIENNERTEVKADYTAYYEICRGNINDPAAISYLQARGISKKTAEACGIGYDPAADPATAPGAIGGEYKAHPTPRIIAPCTNDFYIARSIDPSTPAQYKAPNPKGSKAQIFNAEAMKRGADIIFITEGIFDALSIIEMGQQAIALNGKGNAKLLTQLLQEQPTEAAFVICPDNDSNPTTAADTMKRARELKNNLRHMNYKSIIYNVAGQSHDINEAIQVDRAALMQAIEAAIKEIQRDDLTDFLDRITTDAYRPHKTGLKFFDDILSGGIVQQSLLLLMAAPGAGKTTLAQQIAETIAENKSPVIYFNFEMSSEQMLAKAISAKLYRKGCNKSALQILQGYNWNISEREQIEATIDEYRAKNYPYIRYNPAGISSNLNELLSYLTATGEAAKAAGKQAPAAIVDYLHLISSSEKIDTAELIKQAITGLKKYAVDYNTFVIAISATNRDSMKSGRITLESGRDSSNIEYTGDYVLSLQYDAIDRGTIKPDNVQAIADLQQQTKRLMILRVLKNRLAQPGKSVNILLDGAHNIFYNTYDEDIPAEGFILDNGAPAFEDDNITMII